MLITLMKIIKNPLNELHLIHVKMIPLHTLVNKLPNLPVGRVNLSVVKTAYLDHNQSWIQTGITRLTSPRNYLRSLS
jgi:hypothetical protein